MSTQPRDGSPLSDPIILRLLIFLAAVSGFIGIGVAFLVGEFGNIFQTAVSIFGAIASPIDGLFVVAIIAPWVHGTVSSFNIKFYHLCKSIYITNT